MGNKEYIGFLESVMEEKKEFWLTEKDIDTADGYIIDKGQIVRLSVSKHYQDRPVLFVDMYCQETDEYIGRSYPVNNILTIGQFLACFSRSDKLKELEAQYHEEVTTTKNAKERCLILFEVYEIIIMTVLTIFSWGCAWWMICRGNPELQIPYIIVILIVCVASYVALTSNVIERDLFRRHLIKYIIEREICKDTLRRIANTRH